MNDLIEFIQLNINKYTESGNGNIVNTFKIDKKDLTDENVKDFIQEYSKYKEYARWKKSNLPSDKWYVSQDKSEDYGLSK